METTYVIPGIKYASNLDARYTFENFIQGKSNQLARSMALAITSHWSNLYEKPIFIQGDSGNGKTHLAQAIGNFHKDKRRVLYMTANNLFLKLEFAKRRGLMLDFYAFFENIDVLIFDNIQDAIYKDGIPNVLIQIFDKFYMAGKQIIITSDKLPHELYEIDNRIKTRFKWGLVAEIKQPDFDLKKAIIQKIIYEINITLGDEEIIYIASNIVSNIREIECILNTIYISNQTDIAYIKKLIGEPIAIEFSIDYIQKVVCTYFSIPVEMLQSNTRKREIVQARQIAMYFSKNLTKSSLATIGEQIGDKDHATVLHACKTINNLIDTEKKFKLQLDEIESRLYKQLKH